jgi:ribosome-binding factor A
MKSTSNRIHRIAELLQRALATVIQKEFSHSKMGWVTIVGVEVSRDLAHAKVFVSVLQEEKISETVKTLNDAAGFFRGVLSHQMNMRTVPRFRFIFDESVIRGHRMSALIDSSVLN